MVMRLWAVVIASLVPLAGCSDPQLESGSTRTATLGSDAVPLVPAAATLSTRYYVAPTGSDTNPGSSSAPFKTIERAATVVGAGDSVIVRPGVYTGPSRAVSLTRSGSPGRWITFISSRPGQAVLDGENGRSLVGWYFDEGVAYVAVVGFEIRGFREHGFDFYGGGVHDIMIVRNHVHDIGRNCTDTSNGRTGASLGAGAHRVTFDGNFWHDIGRYVPGEQGCNPRNQYYQNHDHGIYIADADEITIRNNVFLAFRGGWAIHRYHSGDWVSRGITIVNNTFQGQNPYRPGQIILATPTENLTIENNIFHGPQTAALYFEDLSFPGSSVRYNMIYNGVTRVGKPTGVAFSSNWERTDPRFVGGTNLRLRPDSPAIDAWLPLVEVTHDADGVARPRGNGYDLGAYER